MTNRWLMTIAIASVTACGSSDGAPPPKAGARAAPRQDDPKLTQTWTMPKGKSAIESADLGTDPEDVALELMKNGMPGAVHKAATACQESGALKDTASLALRFQTDGSVSSVEGDPSGEAATCMVDAFQKEMSGVEKLPAARALLRMKFHPAQ